MKKGRHQALPDHESYYKLAAKLACHITVLRGWMGVDMGMHRLLEHLCGQSDSWQLQLLLLCQLS